MILGEGVPSCTRDKGHFSVPGKGQIQLASEGLGGNVFWCWTKWQLLVSSVIVGHQELATCHLFFEQNQLFFHGPFGVTVDDGSGYMTSS